MKERWKEGQKVYCVGVNRPLARFLRCITLIYVALTPLPAFKNTPYHDYY